MMKLVYKLQAEDYKFDFPVSYLPVSRPGAGAPPSTPQPAVPFSGLTLLCQRWWHSRLSHGCRDPLSCALTANAGVTSPPVGETGAGASGAGPHEKLV